MFKFKKVRDVTSPNRAHPTDSWIDLYVPNEYNCVLEPLEQALVPTGIVCVVPSGYDVIIAEKSGLASKWISIGGWVIDSSYRGEVKIIVRNLWREPYTIKAWQKIAQAIIRKVELWTTEEVQELDDTERGEWWFWSTGV